MSRSSLFNSLMRSGTLKSPRVRAAFQKVDRADFVPREYLDEAYDDHPLPIGYGQTISQPTTVALMLELLEPKEGERILDVGSGSGWTTALLAHIVGPHGLVFGVEIIPELVEFGRANLEKYHFPYARINLAGEELGLPDQAPFDKILVSAAAEELPDVLVQQLGVEGRMVIPIRNSVWKIDKVLEGETRKQEFPGFVFVPLKTS